MTIQAESPLIPVGAGFTMVESDWHRIDPKMSGSDSSESGVFTQPVFCTKVRGLQERPRDCVHGELKGPHVPKKLFPLLVHSFAGVPVQAKQDASYVE